MKPRTNIIKSYFLGIVFFLSLYCADDKRFIFCIISFVFGLLPETWISINFLWKQQYKNIFIVQRVLLISFLFFLGFLSGFLFVNGTFAFVKNQLLLFLKYSLLFLLIFFFLYAKQFEYSNKYYNQLYKIIKRRMLQFMMVFSFIPFFLLPHNYLEQTESLFLIYVGIAQEMLQTLNIMYSFLLAKFLSNAIVQDCSNKEIS